MHYYIDGYNLLFRVLKAGDDLRTQRENITKDLETKTASLNIDATLVFDSHYQEDEGTRSHLRNLEIVFTPHGETADEYILQELKESGKPSQHTVVTSDKKLAHLCRIRLAKTESVEEFLSLINKRYKNKLRQSKQPPKSVTAISPSKVAQPKPTPPPTKNDSAETCFDFYLNTFENELSQIEKENPTPPPKPQRESKSKKPKKKAASPEEAHLSDTERWLRAFENSKDMN